MDVEEIKERVKNFLEKKCGLGLQDAYFVTKGINEDYWNDIQDDGEDVPEDVEDPEGFDVDAEEPEEPEYEDAPTPPTPPKPTKKPSIINRPNVKAKKPKVVRKDKEAGDEFAGF